MEFGGDIKALILGTLQAKPLHGYEIVRLIRKTGGARRLSEGQMYPYLHELEGVGMLRSEWVTDAEERSRRVYELTQAGTEELARPRSLWERLRSWVEQLSTNGLRRAEVRNA
ncbi:MAG TPA: helix-turn-helix transcriptional regulator [Fimbriimonadaceae bacterium]|nr:helix-turn-helix transcriptional regulator [Fimbriimonadaceae bacterium]